MKNQNTNQCRSVIIASGGNQHIVNHICNTEYVIGYLLSGKMIIRGEQTVTIDCNQLFLMSGGEYYIEYQTGADKLYNVVVVRFSDKELSTIMRNLSLCGDLPTMGAEHPLAKLSHCCVQRANCALATLFRGLREYLLYGLLEQYGDVEQMKKSELIYLLMTNPHSPIAQQLSLLSRGGVGCLQDVVERNIKSRRTICSLAEECGMSPSTFKKRFVELYGQTPHRWLVGRRLEMARMKLIHTCDQVKKIGYDCGFASASHLIRLFAKSYGTTPSVYRARCQRWGCSDGCIKD